MHILHHKSDNVVFLIDDKQGRSMTNNAESICREFSHFNRIIYRDTDNRWDEMIHEHGTFKRFSSLSQEDWKLFAKFLTANLR